MSISGEAFPRQIYDCWLCQYCIWSLILVYMAHNVPRPFISLTFTVLPYRVCSVFSIWGQVLFITGCNVFAYVALVLSSLSLRMYFCSNKYDDDLRTFCMCNSRIEFQHLYVASLCYITMFLLSCYIAAKLCSRNLGCLCSACML